MQFFLLSIVLTLTLFNIESAAAAVSPEVKQHETSESNGSAVMDEEADSFDDEFGDDSFGEDDFSDEFATEEHKEIFDPLSGYNRVMTSFNDKLYVYVLAPVVIKGYNFIPEPVRVSVNNFFENLYFPVSFVNNIFQLKLSNMGTETLRFGINSTLGVLGLFDPARDWFGIAVHQEDFGQTLGYYGVGGGFHIVLPFFGPTNLRDLSGDFIDFYVNPIYYVDVRQYNIVHNKYQGWGLITYKEFNNMSLYTKEYENVRKDALDLYPFIRDLYEQNRDKLIKE